MMNSTEIAKMTQAEKLQAIEALWDSLVQDATPLESPGWHGDVLAARRRKLEKGEARFCSIEELRARSGR